MNAELLATLGLLLIPPSVLYGSFQAEAYLRRRTYRKRVRTLTTWARAHGWQYVHRDDSLARRLNYLPYRWSSGPHWWCRGALFGVHILTGEHHGHSVRTFEWACQTIGELTGAGLTTQYTVVTVSMPTAAMAFQVIPHRRPPRIDEGELVAVATDEAFQSAFHVDLESGRSIGDVFSEDLKRWMLADHRAQRLPIRFEGNEVMVWHQGMLTLDRALWMTDYLIGFAQRVAAPKAGTLPPPLHDGPTPSFHSRVDECTAWGWVSLLSFPLIFLLWGVWVWYFVRLE